MIDSNNINVMREKLRKVSGGGSGVQEEIERIDNLIGSSPIPGSQRTITSSLNYLYDNLGGGGVDYSTEEQDTGLKWIDGRTVYQKSYTGIIGNALLTLIDSDIKPNDVKIIDSDIFAYNSTNTAGLDAIIPGVGEWGLGLHVTVDGLNIASASATYGGIYYVTVKYVKNEE